MSKKQELIDGIKSAGTEWVNLRAADVLEALGESVAVAEPVVTDEETVEK